MGWECGRVELRNGGRDEEWVFCVFFLLWGKMVVGEEREEKGKRGSERGPICAEFN